MIKGSGVRDKIWIG
ncbi:unnamed protein product, partial [Didymodactylos carnosus]